MPTRTREHINKLKRRTGRAFSDRKFPTRRLLSSNRNASGASERDANLREGMVMFGKKDGAGVRSGLTDRLLTTTLLAGAAIAVTFGPASAQTPQAAVDRIAQADDADRDSEDRVVVTGSRIPRTGSDTTTPAPVTVVDIQDMEDRGFVQAGEA